MNKRILQLFDVSLRDGLQSLNKVIDNKSKRNILHNIISRNVKHIEVGSLVSPKILPQFENSVKLYNYAESLGLKDINYYMLVPNSKKVLEGIQLGIKNLSLITSVSDSFQKKNINKSLDDTKIDLEKSFKIIDGNKKNINNVKLYVSCINKCPISGTISPTNIVKELSYYFHNYKNITNLCLSDTCGTLEPTVFELIIDHCVISEGIDTSKLSLHLHCNNNDNNRINEIIQIAINNNITNIDVSLLETGGCSVTINSNDINRNLSYDDISSLKIKYN